MSTNKHIDKICIAAVSLMLVLTIVFMNCESLGVSATETTMKYENTLFDTSYVHTIDIVMNDWDSFIENCEDEEYASCTVVVDGKQYKNTAIRAKGNTSLSSVKTLGSQRYSFKLEFDHYEDGRYCDGLDKLCLNNLIQDNTMMKDYIAYTLMNDFGVDSPLCSYAYITVNGEDWGLYLAVEGIEDSFLERNYGSENGDLYKPDSMSFGAGRGNGKEFDINDFDFSNTDSEQSEDNSTQTPDNSGGENSTSDEGTNKPGGFSFGGQMPGQNGDFTMPGGNMPQRPNGDEQNFDFSQKPDKFGGDFSGDFSGDLSGKFAGAFGGGFSGMGSSDVKLQYIDDNADSYANIFNNAKTVVSKADQKRLISALKNLSEFSDLENTLDTDEVLRYFVVHNFLVNGDSYTGNMIHNYYLYESDGELSMIPWDYNLAFGTFMGGDASSSVNDNIDEVLSDRPMQAWIFSDETYTEQYHELYSEFINKWFTNGELEQLIADTAELLKPYVEKDPTKFCTTEEFDTAVQTMQQFVQLRGQAVSNQLSGDTSAVETGDLNLSDMGSMGGTMGGAPGNTDRPSGENMPNGEDKPSGENMPSGDFDFSNFNFSDFQPGSFPSGTPNMSQ